MPVRRTLLAAAYSLVMSCGVVAPAVAADVTATAFVTKIFDAYKGKNSKGISIDTEADIRRYFEPSLAAMIIKDRRAADRRKEVPTLDGDPFVDAQDWELSALDIAVTSALPDKAVATVTFKNFDEPVKVVLNLVKIKNDWRVADITSQRGERTETLRGLFKH